jgi:hypothetical protein
MNAIDNTTGRAIAICGNDLYVGGDFTDADGNSNADYIARWNGTNRNALGTSPLNGPVYAIAINGTTDVYVGGAFTDAGGVSGANRIARWNSTNNTWNLVGAVNALNNTVRAIAISGNDVYVGGDFTNAGGVLGANRIARWDIANSNWNLVGAENAINNPVRAIAISGNDVYVGGDFTNAVGNNANDYITRRTGTAFVPLGSKTNGPFFGTVNAITVVGTDEYVGACFSTAVF